MCVALVQRVCSTDAALTASPHHLCACGDVMGDACVCLCVLIWCQFDRIWFKHV